MAVGAGLGIPFRNLLIDIFPIPITETPFQPDIFARVAALGIAVASITAGAYLGHRIFEALAQRDLIDPSLADLPSPHLRRTP